MKYHIMIKKSAKLIVGGIQEYIKANKVMLIFLLFLVLSRLPCIFFSLHGVNFDEAAIDYNIFCISNYGVDRYGSAFPVHFANQSSGHAALCVYLGAILTKIIGFSVEKCRLIKLIGEIITFIYGGKVIQRFFSKRAEIIYWFLYIICPYFFKMSGIYLDCDIIIPVFILCIYCSEMCLETGKARWYAGLGTAIGILGYSYIMGVLMTPLLLIYQFAADKEKKKVCITAATAGLLYLPLVWYALTLLNVVPAVRTDYITIAPVSRRRMGDLGFSTDNLFGLKYMFVTDLKADYSGSIRFGTIYQLSWIFAAMGMIRLFLKKDKRYRFMGLLLSAFLPLLLVKNSTNHNFSVVYFFLLAFTAAGMDILFNDYKFLGSLFVAGYLVMFGFFCQEYFSEGIYIYADNMLMAAMDEISEDEKVMLDTTEVIQPESYIGIALKSGPEKIIYDEAGNALSFGNIIFDDREGYLNYDVALIRNDIINLYQTSAAHSGLTDEEAKKMAADYMDNGYDRKKIDGYYIFRRDEKKTEKD